MFFLTFYEFIWVQCEKKVSVLAYKEKEKEEIEAQNYSARYTQGQNNLNTFTEPEC